MSTVSPPFSASPAAANTEKPTQSSFLGRLLLLAVVVAIFGQPNGLVIYFPLYPVVILLIIGFLCGTIVFVKARSHPIALPQINLVLPAVLYLALAVFSLCYAPDPAFGGRILFSMIFKFLLFLAIVIVCADKKSLLDLLFVLALLGSFFSLQGLLILLGTNLFHLQPSGNYNNAANLGSGDVNYNLISYGILGFVKISFVVNGLILSRCQGLFVEPGYFSAFLELSIFATLGWFALTEHRHKKLAYWLLGLQSAGLLFSLASAGWLATAVGIVIYNGLRLFNRPGILSRRQIRRFGRAAAAVTGAVALLCVLVPSVPEAVYFAVYTIKFVGEGQGVTSAEDRVQKADASLHLFSERPLLGWGVAQSAPLNNGKDTGNALLAAASDLGLAGLALALWMLGAVFLTLWNNMRLAYRSRSEALFGLSAAVTGCLGAVFVHSMYLTTQWQFVYWISLALVYVNRRLLLQGASAQSGDTS